MMPEKELSARVAVLESVIDNHSKRLETVEENKELLSKLVFLSEQQAKYNEKMEIFAENSNRSMISIDGKISSIEHKIEDVQEDVTDMGERVGTLEEDKKVTAAERKSTFKATIKWISGIVATILGALILYWLGLK
jgi:predicted  nucleic acid-binding Zn-ribbon protein